MTSLGRVVYRLLLLAFPREVRASFGRDMEQLLADHLTEAGSARGRFRVWTAAAADALAQGLGERLNGTRRRTANGRPKATRWRWWMHALVQDVRYALRMLTRQPGMTAVAVLTLALGIGANTAIFSAVNAVLLRPLPYPQPDRLMTIWEKRPAEGVLDNAASPADMLDWAAMNNTFEHIAGHSVITLDLTGAGDPVRLVAGAISPSFFDVFGTRMRYGRTFRPDETSTGKNRVVILSHPLWMERFGGDPSIVGRPITLNGVSYEVVGILPREFEFAEDGDVWVPLAFGAEPPRSSHYLAVYGRLKSGVSLEQARADMDRVGTQLQQTYPDVNRGHGAHVIPLSDWLQSPVRTSLWLLLAAVGFVLLLACANVANLLLARAATRTREIAVRSALGAGRSRIIGQMLTESVVLALLGGIAGLVVARWAIGTLRQMAPDDVPLVGLDHLGLEPRVLLFALALSVITGLFFGVLPAANVAGQDVNTNLKEGGRSPLGLRKALRGALVVSEVAIASLLLVAAGLSIRSFQSIIRADPGFDSSSTVTFNLSLPGARYPDAAARQRLFGEVETRLAAIPGVKTVGSTTHLPLNGSDARRGITIEGREPSPDTPTRAHVRAITPGYLEAMRIALRQGRSFSTGDHETAPPVVIVNETMSRRYWPNDPSPLGKRLQLSGSDQWLTVVGVAADVKFWGLTAVVNPEMYLPATQYPYSAREFVLRTDGIDPSAIIPTIREQVRQVDPNLPVSRASTLDRLTAASVSSQRSGMWLLACFGALALTLAAAGIYGVMSHMVALRRAEIGIRMTLGAEPRGIMALVMREGARQAALGLLIGVTTGIVLMRIFRSVLYGVSPGDPATLALACGTLFAVAMLACFVPARRAMRVDPMQTLRS